MRFILFFLLTTIISGNAFSQHSSPDTLIAHKINEPILLDGKLNEECWSKAIAITNFTQREQNEGTVATEQTRIAVVYNSTEIYFGILCFDSDPGKISAQQMSRDFDWGTDDDIEVMISPFNDNRNGYLFVTNANGALADIWLGDEGNDFNTDWNGVWDVAVTKDERGWFAEMVIPFSTLKFKNDSIQTWGLNFERNVRRKKEQILWQGWSRLYGVEKVSQSGKLTGLIDIRQKEKIEIKPFIVGGVEFAEGNKSKTGKIGGEVNFDITPTLKLNLTLNTDFAQVESDRQQVNLSRFSIYYPEKRQFFLEGSNYFDMDVGESQLFYSRRIGIDQSSEIPVLGGLKFFGKLNKTSIGIMSLQTVAKKGLPTANSSVFRVKQDIFEQSSVGFITTQKYSKDSYNALYGADFTYSTSKLFGEKNLIIGGSAAISTTTTKLDTVNHNKDNLAYDFFISYPNDVWEFDAGFSAVQDGFKPEMGFTNRGNYKKFYSELQINPRFKNMPKFFRNLIFKPLGFEYYINDKTGVSETFFYEWRPFGFVSKSGESFEFNVQHSLDKPTEDFELVDSIFIPAGAYWDNGLEVQFNTFEGRRISGGFSANIGQFYTGHRQEYSLYANLNLGKHFNIGFDWTKNFISLPQSSFPVDEIGGRIDYAYNPKLNASVFAQWNSEDKEVLLNYRINWIPKVGSFFYFVINQNINTENNRLKLTRTTILAKLIWRFAI